MKAAKYKVLTVPVLLYLLILDKILPGALSALLIPACGGTMVLSAILYARQHLHQIRGKE